MLAHNLVHLVSSKVCSLVSSAFHCNINVRVHRVIRTRAFRVGPTILVGTAAQHPRIGAYKVGNRPFTHLLAYVSLSDKITVFNMCHPFAEESWRTKTCIPRIRAAALRLQYFAMRKERAKQRTNETILTFRATETLVRRAVDRFTNFLFTLPSAPDARKQKIEKIRKLGRILWVNTGVLDASWMEFLRAQCVIDLYDLD